MAKSLRKCRSQCPVHSRVEGGRRLSVLSYYAEQWSGYLWWDGGRSHAETSFQNWLMLVLYLRKAGILFLHKPLPGPPSIEPKHWTRPFSWCLPSFDPDSISICFHRTITEHPSCSLWEPVLNPFSLPGVGYVGPVILRRLKYGFHV
jgi:hypothetical protein